MAAVDSFQLLLQDILENASSVQDTLALFGIFYVTKVSASCIWSFLKAIREHSLSRFWSVDLTQKYGPWAGLIYFLAFALSFSCKQDTHVMDRLI